MYDSTQEHTPKQRKSLELHLLRVLRNCIGLATAVTSLGAKTSADWSSLLRRVAGVTSYFMLLCITLCQRFAFIRLAVRGGSRGNGGSIRAAKVGMMDIRVFTSDHQANGYIIP